MMEIRNDVSPSLLLIAPLDPKGKQNNWPNPSLGILRLASYLRKNFPKWNILIHDIQIDGDDFSKYLTPIDICGISVLHESLINTINFINNWHKRFPETVLIAGGIEAATNYQDIFDYSPCNFVVLGQGEEPLADIMRWYEGKKHLEDIDGIICDCSLRLKSGASRDQNPKYYSPSTRVLNSLKILSQTEERSQGQFIYKKIPKRISNEQYWDYWNTMNFDPNYY